MPKNAFAGGDPPRSPLEELTALPQTLDLRDLLRQGDGRPREGKKEEEREKKGKEGSGREKYGGEDERRKGRERVIPVLFAPLPALITTHAY